eukprot:1354185-Amphidinium_carterae.1
MSNLCVFNAFPSWCEVRQCGLGCGTALCARHAYRRTIREQVVIVCGDCLTAHPKQIPKTTPGNLTGAATFKPFRRRETQA